MPIMSEKRCGTRVQRRYHAYGGKIHLDAALMHGNARENPAAVSPRQFSAEPHRQNTQFLNLGG